MNTFKTKKDITWKNGNLWKKGTEFVVSVNREKPWICEVETLEAGSTVKRLKTENLWHLSNEFVRITEDVLRDSVFDSIVPSMIDNPVEPDGWDSEGFPSVLLASMMI